MVYELFEIVYFNGMKKQFFVKYQYQSNKTFG